MNFRLNKHYPAYIELLVGILIIIIGVMFFIDYQFVWNQFQLIVFLILIINTILHLFKYDKENRKLNVSLSLEVLILAIATAFVHYFAYYFKAMLPMVVGFYILAISLTRFIRFYTFYVDKIKYKYFVLLDAIISLNFALGLIIHPISNTDVFSYYLGAYFIFYGISYLMRGFNKMFLATDARFTMPVPVFIAAFLPGSALENIEEVTSIEKEDKPSDLEVFIYLREGAFGQFGHMDFAYKGKTYSYGCFDYHTHKMGGGYGDGVLIVADRDKFLKHGNVFKKATVIKYGLKLNEEQKQLVEGRIESLLERCEPYYSDSQRDEIDGNLKDEYDSYLANVYLNTKADTYKFTHGKFKTYFVLSTNCVNVTAYVLQMKNLDIINIKGLITPGTYLHYLNKEYLSNSKIVVSRYVYEK